MSDKYPRSTVSGIRDYTHRHIARAILDRSLRGEECVHHADGDNFNNALSNLVICPNLAYHNLLHKRMEAFLATGDPNKRKCYLCKTWTDPSFLTQVNRSGKGGNFFYHKACTAANYHAHKESILENRRFHRSTGREN